MRVIGLISGTSVDGIDAALAEISGRELDLQVELIAAETYAYSPELRSRILAVCSGAAISLAELARLDDAIAREFAEAALKIQRDHKPAELIGSHGQTVFHRPPEKATGNRQQATGNGQQATGNGQQATGNGQQATGNGQQARGAERAKPETVELGYSLQLGRGAVIAEMTGLPTVNNFRAADLAAGGEGAPFVSRVDVCLLSDPEFSRCVQNIGGIGNFTYLPPLKDAEQIGVGIQGWDTGPGNSLLDLAVQHLSEGKKSYDHNGEWAAQGTPCQELVNHWLEHDYFRQPPPKSTGRELFGWDYFQACLHQAEPYHLSAADLLATLTELTAASIALSYRQFLPNLPDQVLICGGGARNLYLKQRLANLLAPIAVLTTDEVGLSADAKEAIAFAVLAYWRTLGIPGNLPAVTGARQAVLSGDLQLSYR